MTEAEKTERFVQHLAENQNRLHGYVFSLVGDHTRASDVVQETNLVLWRKLDQYDPQRPFLPWAMAFARFQVLAHLRDRSRDRMLLDPDLVELVSVEAEKQASQLDGFQAALVQCMKTLTETNRRIIELRYFQSLSVADVAKSLSRPVGSVKVSLFRARQLLGQCVGSKMEASESMAWGGAQDE